MPWTPLKPPTESAEFTCWVPGRMAGKKNHYRSRPGGGIYKDPKTTVAIDAMIGYLLAARVKQLAQPIIKFSVEFDMRVSGAVAVDPDNAIGSLMDALQEAGVIANDGPRNAIRGSWAVSTCAKGEEGVQVTVRSVEGI